MNTICSGCIASYGTLVGVISRPSPWRRLILPDVPWLMPSAFMLRQASMIDWRFSRSFVADISTPSCRPREQWLIIAPQYSRTYLREKSDLGAIMTNAVLGIIGGSGIYDLPGLENVRDETIESPWGEASAPGRTA